MQIKHLVLAAVLLAPAALSAQTATFTPYGSGCGSRAGNPCLSANWGLTFSGNAGVSANFGILFRTGSTAMVVCGVELFCSRTTGPTNFAVSIWDRQTSGTTTGQPGKSLASAMMPVTSTPQANRAMFSSVLILQANTDYFVVLDNRVGLRLPIMSSGLGTSETHYYNGPPTWSGPHGGLRWNYRILCCGTGPVPKLSNTGVPFINKSFSIDLSSATANAKALWAVGAAQAALDLTPAGAPGCTLLTNPLAVFPVVVDTQGNGAVKLTVPNSTGLIGFTFYNQFGLIDSGANALGLIFSNGGVGKVGT